ncbi:MAG: hypothetical protein Q7S69_09380 [Nitrosomonadaceae bacterium]|nr:hypothetical protein [Nitrosomonadaceae bacterium]
MKPTSGNVNQARDNSMQEASDLLMGSAECIAALLKLRNPMDALTKFPALVGTHAMLQIADFLGERLADAIENIAESADWLASHPDGEGDDVSLEEQLARRKVYEALKAAFVRDNPETSQQEYTRVMRQYERLLGL